MKRSGDRSAIRFEEFDRIPVRILNLDLSATRTGLHLVTKGNSGPLQFSMNPRRLATFKANRFQPPHSWRLLNRRCPNYSRWLFEMYCQAKPTAHMGTGFGLPIAKSIIEQYRGTIRVESR